ncbi:DUF6434 domain-containing protein [Halopseudomonas pachastrellae]|nr:DUF6434 domain-containing protein [Halopseudomonas pachastrellae]
MITPQRQSMRGIVNTQNVRRFMREACGPAFRFDRSFMAWMRDGTPKTMGARRLSG